MALMTSDAVDLSEVDDLRGKSQSGGSLAEYGSDDEYAGMLIIRVLLQS